MLEQEAEGKKKLLHRLLVLFDGNCWRKPSDCHTNGLCPKTHWARGHSIPDMATSAKKSAGPRTCFVCFKVTIPSVGFLNWCRTELVKAKQKQSTSQNTLYLFTKCYPFFLTFPISLCPGFSPHKPTRRLSSRDASRSLTLDSKR